MMFILFVSSGLGLPGSLGLPPSHPYSSLYTDPLHAELLAREAHRAAELRSVENYSEKIFQKLN